MKWPVVKKISDISTVCKQSKDLNPIFYLNYVYYRLIFHETQINGEHRKSSAAPHQLYISFYFYPISLQLKPSRYLPISSAKFPDNDRPQSFSTTQIYLHTFLFH